MFFPTAKLHFFFIRQNLFCRNKKKCTVLKFNFKTVQKNLLNSNLLSDNNLHKIVIFYSRPIAHSCRKKNLYFFKPKVSFWQSAFRIFFTFAVHEKKPTDVSIIS